MKKFIVYSLPEPTSFKGAPKVRAVEVLTGAGHEIAMTDLYADDYDPRGGFTTGEARHGVGRDPGGPDSWYNMLDTYPRPIEFGCIEYMGMELSKRFVA